MMRFYYFNSTHWDREWYEPMQKFRRHLVDTTGVLLDALESGELEKFTFDGQTIVLEDVSEIHPEWRARLQRQISSGRLNVGPWYVQPDEFLASGEALIRNLQIGRETAYAFGAETVWPVGYLCDMFGHIAQMPQLLAGFGIDQAVMWRGVDGDFPPFFLWRAPDGTSCKTVRLFSRFGYAEFSIYVLGLWQSGFDENAFKQAFVQYVNDVRPYFGDDILLSDALDHIMPRTELKQIFRWIQELYPDSEIIHTDYQEVRPLFHDQLPVFDGELIRTADSPDHNGRLLTNCLSARYDIKAANDRLQNRLELEAGMIQAAAGLAGNDKSYPYWKLAWKKLVANHAHDSICGCAVDTVHRRMLQDFEEIGHLVSIFDEDLIYRDREACVGVAIADEANNCELAPCRARTEGDEAGNYAVRIFNPMPFERDGVVDFEIDFPASADYPSKCGELNLLQPFFCFRLFDSRQHEIEYSVNQVRHHQVRRFYRHDSREYHVYSVSARLRLRASGWTTVTVRPSATPVRFLQNMLVSPLVAENDFLRLEVHQDATFAVLDKRNGRKYGDWNNYVIDRDIGDGWLFAKGQGTLETVGSTSGCRVDLVEKSPFRTTFLLTREYRIAKRLNYEGTLNFEFDRFAESKDDAILKIQTFLSLEQGSDMLKVRSEINNTVSDCRVRLVMPTMESPDYFVSQSYAMLRRPAGRRSGTASASYMEAEPLEKNFSGIAGRRDERGGAALLSGYGLHEVAAETTPGGELYFTLYRAFGRTVRDGGGEDGQLRKRLTFEYAYCCFGADCDEASLFNRMQALRALPKSHTIALKKCRALPETSLLTVGGEVGYCTFSPSFADHGSAMLRVVNLSGEERTVRMTFGDAVDVTQCALDESIMRVVGARCGSVSAIISPGEIATFSVKKSEGSGLVPVDRISEATRA